MKLIVHSFSVLCSVLRCLAALKQYWFIIFCPLGYSVSQLFKGGITDAILSFKLRKKLFFLKNRHMSN